MADSSRTAVAVLPARYASERLPGKPLLKETGKYLIQHVCEQVGKASLISRVIVATDDDRILEAVRSFGGEAVMTSPDHKSGTDRVAEVARDLEDDLVINVQGDEPDIDPQLIDALVRELYDADMATLATEFSDAGEADKPERVKVVTDRNGYALYFSRARIPHGTNGALRPLLHIGLYGYTKSCLLRLTSLPPTPLEKAERLEQLRALENGIRIKVAKVDWDSVGGIDTREDYESFVRRNQES